MADRKSFLLRIDQEILNRLQRWADDELRSLNGQVEYVLRKALQDSGRYGSSKSETPPEDNKPTNSQ
jgi:hypothetical protein